MDSGIAQKQSYLCREILDAGYDPESFLQYLIQVNPSRGEDLSRWTMSDLRKIVDAFKLTNGETLPPSLDQLRDRQTRVQQKPVQKQQDPPSDTTDAEKTVTIEEAAQEVEQKENPIIMRETGTGGDYCKQVGCKALSQTISADDKFTITKYQKKQGGIFSKAYVIYIIESSKTKTSVVRRYNEFVWLRQNLELLHPGICLPPLSKKGPFRRYDDKHLRKRMWILQKFLDRVQTIQELSWDPLIEGFLYSPSFDKIQSKFKNQQPREPHLIQRPEAVITVRFDRTASLFLNKTQKFLETIQPEVKNIRIYKGFKAAATALEECQRVMSQLTENCQQLAVRENAFRAQTGLLGFKNNVFNAIAQITSNSATYYASQAQTFRKQMYSFVKFESLNMLNQLESLEKLGRQQTEFAQAKINLSKRKQRLSEEGNQSRWGIDSKLIPRLSKTQIVEHMLPKQTQELGAMQFRYAFENGRLYDYFQHYFATANILMADSLWEFTVKNSQMVKERLIEWADIQTTTMAMRQGKGVKTI